MNFLKRKELIIPAVVVLVVVGTILLINSAAKTEDETASRPTNVPAVTSDSKGNDDAVDGGATGTEMKVESKPAATDVTINSKKLANNYFVYEKGEYEKAKAANRPIFLYFHANWCPTCARQEPINLEFFNNLGATNLIAFRVNFNDSDTSSDEKALAEDLGVTYQHTFFTFNASGKQIDKFLGDTDAGELKVKIQKVL